MTHNDINSDESSSSTLNNRESSSVLTDQGSHETIDNDDAVITSTTRTTERVLESIMRISLAGFGGALVGLSLSRQQSYQSATMAAAPPSRRRRRRAPVRVMSAASTTTSTLPLNWAFACAGFCTLMEVSRWASPTSMVTPSRHLQTIGDCTIGGAAAGAAFRGMQVGAAATNAALRRPNVLSGLTAGIVLGFVAGIVQCGANVFEEMMEKERLRQSQQSSFAITGDEQVAHQQDGDSAAHQGRSQSNEAPSDKRQ